MPYLPSLPETCHFPDIVAAFPDPLVLLRPYGQSLMYGPGPLTLGERELISAYVSSLNACRYCFGTHEQAARAHGVDPERLRAIAEDLESAPEEERWKALLRFVRKETLEPARITQADVDAVFAAGWSEAALVRAVLLCGYFNMLNRMLDSFGVVADEGHYRDMGKELARRAVEAQAQLSAKG